MSSLSDSLRSAIAASGRTHYALAKAAGIRPQMIDYFMREERTLTLDSADKLATVLALTLSADKNRERRIIPSR